jgi:glycosyltransferase involved in cell wall biosynthesis
MSAPRVSVVVTCHDLGVFLEEAVQSALTQSFADLEVVVVDDGSRDSATVALLDTYLRPRTRVVRMAHGGLSAARNRGLAESRGELLVFLDADDILEPAYVARAVAVLDAAPEIAFVSSWIRAFGAEEWEWRRDRCDLVTLLAECTVNGAAVIRRAAIVQVGGYDDAMREGNEDWDLWIRLARAGFSGTVIPEVLFRYRRRPGSMSRVCMAGDTHLRLVEALANKHAEAYGTHIVEVLALKDREVATLEGDVAALELECATLLPAEVARLRDDVSAARGRALSTALREGPRGESRAPLEQALRHAEARVASLEASLSWRLTHPLRLLHAALRRGGAR